MVAKASRQKVTMPRNLSKIAGCNLDHVCQMEAIADAETDQDIIQSESSEQANDDLEVKMRKIMKIDDCLPAKNSQMSHSSREPSQ